MPTLSDGAKQVLDLIVRHNIWDGSSLVRRVGLGKRDELVDSLRELQALDLIQVGGPVTAEELPFTKFGVLPSAREYVYSLLKSLK